MVVVGSGPAGLAAARAFRKLDIDSPVTMITEDPHPPYARPPLTKDFLRGESELDDLWLTDPGWAEDERVEIRDATSATAVDPGRQAVITDDGMIHPYAALVLATGSQPVPLPVPGGDLPGLIHVRDLSSGHRLRELAARSDRPVIVVGSGFIGCEAAASLALRGVPVTLVSAESLPHEERLGESAGREIHRWLLEAGVLTRMGSPVSRIEECGDGFAVELESSGRLTAAAVVVGGGARPDLTLAEPAGLTIANGGIVVDASMRTTVPGIFAVGDIAYAQHAAAGRRLRVEHWGDAETHGQIAGAVAAGAAEVWDQPPGFWSTIGDQTLKYTAWDDGHDGWTFTGDSDRWSVWFRKGKELCGVLTHEDDDAYELGRQLLGRRARFAEIPADVLSTGSSQRERDRSS